MTFVLLCNEWRVIVAAIARMTMEYEKNVKAKPYNYDNIRRAHTPI